MMRQRESELLIGGNWMRAASAHQSTTPHSTLTYKVFLVFDKISELMKFNHDSL